MAAVLPATLWLLSARAAPAPTETEKVAAWARLYGVLRWFHPSDAAQEVDWDQLAVRGVRAVRAAQTRADLERTLRALVAPVAVGVVIGAEPPAGPAPAGDAETRLVAWRHLGFGQGASGGGIYRSARTHRGTAAAGDGFATMMQTVPAAPLRGRTIRLSAQVKAETTGQEGAAALWLRVDRGQEPAFFDNMNDRPIRRAEWREYAVDGAVDADATQVAFGVMAHGKVQAGFDAVALAVREADGSWRGLPIADPGFETEGGWFRAGNSAAIVASRERGGAPEGRQWLALRSATTGAVPFDAPLRAGSYAEVELLAGLRARVALVLDDAEATMSPEQKRLIDAQRSDAAAIPAASPQHAALADVVVAWNVFRHFYPYWPEVGVDWDARLPPLVEAAAAAVSVEDHHDVLRRLVAEVHDGHGFVNEAKSLHPPGLLPLAVRQVQGRWVVTASSVPDQVRPGDVVTSVDGRPAASWFAAQEALASGSRQWRAVRAAAALASGARDSRVSLRLERAGAAVAVELTRKAAEPARESRPDSIGELRPGLWYVDLTRADWAAVEPRLPDLTRAEALVFDVRGYPTDAGMRILTHLMAAPETHRWMHVPRFAEPFGRVAGWDSHGWNLSPAPPRLAGTAAFLTDARAISYAESVMGYVEALGLGAIVGGPTAGTNGNVNTFTVPSGRVVAFTGMRVTRHDGTAFHLAGVRPTVAVEPTLAGIREGRDEVLERALAHLGR
jgi:hypothetical protein